MANETFTVTETIVLKPGGGDTDGDNVIDPGEIVRTTVTITNNSTTPTPIDAIGLQFSQTLNGMTLFDQVGLGDINVSPIAFGDSYAAIGNTLLEVGNATGQTGPQSSIAGHVTDNDLEFFGGTFTISAFQATSTQNGIVTMITSGVDMGSFTYVSAAGFTGTDTFTYTIRDTGLDGIAGNTDDLTSTATVTITVANKVWYVDNSFAGVSNGTSTNPFTSLAAVSGPSGPDGVGDTIYVRTGNADYTGGITLLDDQILHGAGSALVVGGFNLAAAGTDPTIVNAAGNGVTLEQGNTLTGFTIGNTTGFDIANATAATVGNLTISNVNLAGTGGLIRADAGGTLDVTIDSGSTTSAAGNGIHLAGATSGSFTVTGGAISGVAGTDVLVNGGTAAINIGSSITSNAGGSIDIGSHATGNVTLSGAINITGGTGISVHNNTSGIIAFTNASKVVSTLGNNAVDLDTNTGATINFTGGGLDIDTTTGFGFQATGGGTFSVTGSGNSVTTTTGTALDLNGVTVGATGMTLASVNTNGAANGILISSVGQSAGSTGIDVLGGAIVNASTRGVDILSTSADVAIASTISTTPAGRSVEVTNSGSSAVGGNTIVFSGAIDENGTGINLDNNDQNTNGATINFTGGLDIDSTTNTGFNAINGGTVNVTGTNTINNTTGIGVNVASTTIGASGLTFQTIANSGAANGIVLNNTGAGAFTVTGTGSAGSGGTINAATGTAGISLIGTGPVTLGRMIIQNSAADGVSATTVAGFRFDNSSALNNGNAVQERGLDLTNVTGTVTVINSVVTGNAEDNFRLHNESGTVNLTITGSTFANVSTSFGNDGVHILADGTSTVIASITGSTFTNHRGDHFQVTTEADANSTTHFTFSGNTLTGDRGTVYGGNDLGAGITINPGTIGANSSNVTFNIANNNIQGAVTSAIMINRTGDNGTTQGTIQGNTIGTPGTTDSGSSQADGITVFNADNGTVTVLIHDNDIYQWSNASGIQLRTNDGNGRLNATVTNNLLSNPGPFGANGLLAHSGAVAGDAGTMYLDIENNTMGGSGANGSTDFRVRQRIDTDVFLEGYGGGQYDDAAVVAYLQARNTGAETGSATHQNGSPDPDGFFTTVAVPLPNNPTVPPAPLFAALTPPPEPDGSGKGDGTGGGFVTPTPDPEGAIVVDVTVLDEAELALVTETAIQLWEAAGASAEQIEAMRGVSVSLGNLPGVLGYYHVPGELVIDYNAAGRGWTPQDLLTVLLQELAGEANLHAALPSAPDTATPPAEAPTAQPDLPDSGTPAPADGQSIIVDDGFLSQAELDFFVDAAFERWAATGLTAEQLAALEGLTFRIAEMSGLNLGSYDNGLITIDSDGAGRGWYADATPLEDSEFANAASATRLNATPGTPPAGRFDLLTTILHEMGHALGLSDLYDDASRDELLYGYLFAGERRLPGADDAVGAIVGSVTSEAFAGSLIQVLPADASGGLFTLPAGQSVTIQWDATIDLQQNQLIVNPVNQGLVSATNPPTAFPDQNTNSVTTTLDTLTLGGTVWADDGGGGGFANNGLKDGSEGGIDGVTVSLFVDSDNNDAADTPGTPLVTGVITTGGGNYSFTGLAPGNYIVRIDSGNFGAMLANRVTSPGSPDPDTGDPDTDNDDNGFLFAGAVFSNAITLAYNSEPTAGLGNDTNDRLDFGFVTLNRAPVHIVPGAQAINEEAPRTFSAGVGNQISVNDPDVGAGNLTVTLSVAHGTLSLNGIVGLSVTTGTGTNDATMTFSGTQAAVNTALNGLVYTPTTHFNGADTLTITTNDNGNTGLDPGLSGDINSEQDSDTVAIAIADVNDAPTVGDGTETAPSILVDTPVGRTVSSLFASQFSDALDVQVSGGNPTGSAGDSFGGIAVSGNVTGNAAGEWQFHNGAVWANIGARTSSNALIVNGADQIRFNPGAGYSGPAPDLTAHLVETGAAVTTGSSIDLVANPPGGTTQISTGTVVLSQNVSASATPPVANNDAFTTDEATAITASNLFANNGAGADTDAEGDPFSVTAVTDGTVGAQFMLPSGALLTVNANGTFNYNPNGAFNATPGPGSGAANQPAFDSFIYTITDGDTAQVTITINGIDTNDYLLGTAGQDTLLGGDGNDTLVGGDGGDTLLGEDGNDHIEGGAGQDGLLGGAGIDTLVGGLDGDWLFGDGDGDTLLGEGGDDHMEGGTGRDGMNGGAGLDHMVGGLDGDWMFGEGDGDTLLGEDGDDWMEGGAGRDGMIGGAGIDHMVGGLDGDWMFGGGDGDSMLGEDGDDWMEGGAGRDGMHGGAGEDFLLGGADGDWMFGGNDDDVLLGEDGDDLMEGGAGRDGLAGGLGNDQLFGDADDDWLFGGDDDDVLNGGGGADYLEGGAGSDLFVFNAALGGGNVDNIGDFAVGIDKIVLDDAIFGLPVGNLAPGAFVIGTQAGDIDDRIIYDQTNGALFFDADGSGGGAAVQFATLQAGLALTASDFTVI